ncbi:MAG: alpha/beta hydrolase [Bacteroidales bacterium]|nr:alpha/beta hydrolase [Bacteroidales bacterium]
MKRFLILLASAFTAAMCTTAPKDIPENLLGTWSGELDPIGLALTLHLGDTCTVDSPDQGAFGLRAQVKEISEESLWVKFPDFHAGLKAKVQGDSLIGSFSQMGVKASIAMVRGPLVRNRPQTPVPPFPYLAEEICFNNGDISLAGTFTLPESLRDVPVVVMVSGSGKQDRDETLMEHKPFAVLADALARAGIPSLRYDDRECGASGGVFAEATTADFASDAASAVKYLRDKGFTKVGIIGHSEGGTIAFMLAGAETPDKGTPDFIISLAGMADRGDSTLLRQTARMLELQGAPKKAAALGAKISYKQILKQKSVWMDYFVSLDPAPYVSRIKCPVLALNGSKDSQVIPEYNLSKVEALCPQADCRLYPDLNHLFQHCSTGLGTEYARIEETMSEEAISDIIAWIKELQEE